MTIVMNGKRGLIMGVANNRSIAWGIADAMHKAGAELAFSYQGESLLKRVGPLSESVGDISDSVADLSTSVGSIVPIVDRLAKVAEATPQIIAAERSVAIKAAARSALIQH